MSTRSERISSLVTQSGKSYQELEKLTGIKKSSLQRYASGATSKIPLDAIEKLAVAFNVSQEYLMGWVENEASLDKVELTEGEKVLLDLFNRVPEEQQEMVLQMIRVALGSRE